MEVKKWSNDRLGDNPDRGVFTTLCENGSIDSAHVVEHFVVFLRVLVALKV